MPVAYLGLTVSHIPSATSFYLEALQPLGYRYIGQSGDSIGLGVTEADFFLTQEPKGASVSPTHIAFTAEDRLTVRQCYAAALSAGAHPSGAPGYRNGEGTAFNAAVEDLDGNVVEFIWRDPTSTQGEHVLPQTAPSEHSRVLSWQKDVASSGLHGDAGSLLSQASRAKSRTQTAFELVSKASASVRSASDAASPGLRRAHTEPVAPSTNFPSKSFLGTLIGVAAAGAVCYAMGKTEQDSTRQEAAYSAARGSRSSSNKTRQDSTRQEAAYPTVRRSQSASRKAPGVSRNAKSHRNYSVTESHPPKSHRNFSVTESHASRRYPPRGMRAIEPSAYYDDDEVQEAISRYTSSCRTQQPQRSKTVDAIEYAPISVAGRSSRHHSKRSTTERPNYAAIEEAPRSAASRSSHRSVKRSSTMPVDTPDRHLEAYSNSTISRYSRHRSGLDDDDDLKRRDSGVSIHSHRSRHTAAAGDPGRRPSTSTVKPFRYGALMHRDRASDIPLPPSKASSYATATQMPIPESHGNEDWVGEESDGLNETKTVVPDDSISCVDVPKPGGRSRTSRHSDRGSKRSEADSDRTVRPARSRHSARTLPARPKEDYRSSGGGKKGGALSYT